jgi:hypothetical protein
MSGGPNLMQMGRSAVGAAAANIKQSLEAREERRRPYIPTAEESFCMKFIEEANRVRTVQLYSYEPLWVRCILYCAGIQHLRYLPTTRSFEPLRQQDWMPYPVINMIQSKVERAVNFFTHSRPAGGCIPEGQHEDNKEAAKHGDKILKFIHEDQNEAEKLDEAANWLIVTGNTFKKVYADQNSPIPMPTVGITREPLLHPETQQPVMNRAGLPVMTTRYQDSQEPVPQVGTRVKTDVVGPLHMTVPLAATRFDDSPWAQETTLQSLEELRKLYPDKADYIGDEGRAITSDIYIHRILTIMSSGYSNLIQATNPYALEGFGVVHHHERRPTVEFPNGILVVSLNNIPLLIDELPLGHRFSWNHCGYHRVSGRFWFRGAVEDAIDPQNQVNKLEQFFRVNDDFNSNPQWLRPKQSGIPEGALTNKPGRTHEFIWPFKPEVLQGVSMPPQMIQRLAMYMDVIDEVMQVKDVLVGNAPAGVRAGVALNRLKEEAEGGFEPIAKRWNTFLGKDAEMKLEAVARYWSEPQSFTLEGDDGTVEQVKDFVGTMLQNVRRFRVDGASWRPSSHSQKQQLILDLWEAGLIPGILMDPEQHRQLMDVMGLEGFEAEQSADYKRSKLENEQLIRSVGWEKVVREPGDDDMVHLAVHAKLRKAPEWAKLPNVVKSRVLLHEAEHLKAIMLADGMADPANMAGNPEAIVGSEEAAEGQEPQPGQGGQNEAQTRRNDQQPSPASSPR